jgi:hypothetical protein
MMAEHLMLVDPADLKKVRFELSPMAHLAAVAAQTGKPQWE